MLSPNEIQKLRNCFPFFNNADKQSQCIYLDNAATTQKLGLVIDCIHDLWIQGSANVHRSSHNMASTITERYEHSRQLCSNFINSNHSSEIIWTSGTTESINLVAESWGNANIKQGDEILISEMEHHANLLPWQRLCKNKGAKLKVIPINDKAELDIEQLDTLLNAKVKLVALCHISNALGTINPIKNIIAKCHEFGAKVLIDGAQAIAHLPLDVQQIDCDFYTFSGHKCFGPDGIGVLYGKQHLLESMPPWKVGGEMVISVDFEKTTYQPPPLRFEAGTANIAGVLGFAEAIKFLMDQDREALLMHEQKLASYTKNLLSEISAVEIHSVSMQSSSIIAFSIKGCHCADAAALLDEQNVAIRSGYLCAMPLVKNYNQNGILRVSLSFYNTTTEIDYFINALKQAINLLKE